MEADWRESKTARECLAHLCLTERMSDVIFGFPDSPEKLHAHKFVLGMRSAVFEAMFYGPMAEKKQEIMIKDSDPETFKLFLRYLYSYTTDLEDSMVLGCHYLSRKYCVEGLSQACFAFLETSVSAENLCAIYEQACQFDMPDLQKKCLRLMADRTEPILQSVEFLAVSNKTLLAFLNCDDLNADEISVFKASVKWAKHQCAECGVDELPENIRKHIGDALYSIRIPTFPIKTFAEVIGPCQLLTSEEEVQIYRFMATNSDVEFESKGSVGRFKAYKRKPSIFEVVFSNGSTNSTSFTESAYKMIEFFISLSSRLKLLTVSDTKFCDGVKNVIVNSIELKQGDEWLSKDDELVFIRGATLTEGKNIVVVITKNPVVTNRSNSSIRTGFAFGSTNTRSEKSFNVLGTNIRVDYDRSTGRKITFGK